MGGKKAKAQTKAKKKTATKKTAKKPKTAKKRISKSKAKKIGPKTKARPKTKAKSKKPKPTKPAAAPRKEKPKPKRKLEQPVKLVGHPTSMVVFGTTVTEAKIRSAAIDAYRKRIYDTDDIHIPDFFGDRKHDNLMVKIALLDRVQEMVGLLYPGATVERKNKITLVVD